LDAAIVTGFGWWQLQPEGHYWVVVVVVVALMVMLLLLLLGVAVVTGVCVWEIA